MTRKAGKKPRNPKTILEDVRKLAVEYYDATGKALGVTGELAEAAAADKLKLELAPARTAGYDATEKKGRRTLKVQIKGRRIEKQQGKSDLRGRVSKINLDHEFDEVVLVLMNSHYEPEKIWRAGRAKVEAKLKAPGSKARNERGTLSVSQFVSIAGKEIWSA